MVRIGASDLMFGDVELRFEMTQAVDEPRAMFLLDRTPRLQFQNSVLTIQAPAAYGEWLAFMQLAPPRSKEMMPGDDTMNTGSGSLPAHSMFRATLTWSRDLKSIQGKVSPTGRVAAQRCAGNPARKEENP